MGYRTRKSSSLPRGIFFEEKIKKVMKEIKNFPNVIPIRLDINKKFIKKGTDYVTIYEDEKPCDFLFLTPSNVWLLDAKETKDKSWYPRKNETKTRNGVKVKVKNHQIEAFEKVIKWNTFYKAGFIVFFTEEDPLCMNPRLITDFENKSTIDSGQKFSWELII